MAQADKVYHNLLMDILENGNEKSDRTGTGTISVFGRQIRFNLKNNTLPIITTKKIHTRGVVEEILWFLRGETNIKALVDKNVNIWVGDAFKNYCKYTSANSSEWDEWMRDNGDGTLSMYTEQQFIEKIKTDEKFAEKWGELGPIYGKQWRKWVNRIPSVFPRPEPYQVETIDQIAELIHKLKNTPDDRRMIVSAWNVAEIKDMVLPPCHNFFQCYTRELSLMERNDIASKMPMRPNEVGNSSFDEWGIPKRALTLMWNQRSIDTPLGLPFNIASYAILAHLLAKECNMVAEELIGTLGDTHIYKNQIDGINEQLTRDIDKFPSAKINIKNYKSFDEIMADDIEITGYESYPAIKMPLSN